MEAPKAKDGDKDTRVPHTGAHIMLQLHAKGQGMWGKQRGGGGGGISLDFRPPLGLFVGLVSLMSPEKMTFI